MGLLVALLEGPPGEVVAERTEELVQGLSLRVHVDEHEPTPAAHLHLGQAPVLGDVREVPLARHVGEVAVEIPREAVERAPQEVGPARLLLEEPASVQAQVVEGLDGVGR